MPEQLLFPQQDHIGSIVVTSDSESLAIRRPLEFADIVRGEVSDLVSGRTVEGLHENVVHALIANRVGQRLSVGRETQGVGEETAASSSGDAWIGLKQAGSARRIRVEVDERQ